MDERPRAADNSPSLTSPAMKGPKSEDSGASLSAGAKAATVGRLIGERAFHLGSSTTNLIPQADLKRDTEKLLKLATELKESVDKTSKSTLSLNVIKKAEEIERLAHSVKDKMKAAY